MLFVTPRSSVSVYAIVQARLPFGKRKSSSASHLACGVRDSQSHSRERERVREIESESGLEEAENNRR